PAAVELRHSTCDRGHAEPAALAARRGASLAIAAAGWKKPPDQPATAKLVFEFENEKFSKSPQIEIKAAGLDGRFAVVLGGDRQRIDHIDIRRLLVGGNDLAGSVGRRTGGGWRADIHAARLAGQNLLKGAIGDTGPGST